MEEKMRLCKIDREKTEKELARIHERFFKIHFVKPFCIMLNCNLVHSVTILEGATTLLPESKIEALKDLGIYFEEV
jgi:hypothetical protein